MRKKARRSRFIESTTTKENSEISYHVDKSMKFSYYVCGVDKMTRKTVAINDDLIRDLDIFARKEHRDFSSALRYALRIGLLAIENPELTVQEIKDIIEARIDHEMGNVSELDTEEL
ncbi:MAG: hypothetical protein OEY25_07330 [Candidatus Aminicenantes bacterium]|nr:hypothetical protein [Candidatus Aminicenantes bacterium]MDH5705137.1 hypothetical protein [Candidatus Aminicenantes bacterium]